jgi:hypothetical protein
VLPQLTTLKVKRLVLTALQDFPAPRCVALEPVSHPFFF